MTKVKIGFFAVVSALILIIFFRNWQSVSIDLLVIDEIPMPLSILLTLVLLLGIILGFAISAFIRMRRNRDD